MPELPDGPIIRDVPEPRATPVEALTATICLQAYPDSRATVLQFVIEVRAHSESARDLLEAFTALSRMDGRVVQVMPDHDGARIVVYATSVASRRS